VKRLKTGGYQHGPQFGLPHDKNRQQILVIKLKVCQQADLVKDPGIVDYLPFVNDKDRADAVLTALIYRSVDLIKQAVFRCCRNFDIKKSGGCAQKIDRT